MDRGQILPAEVMEQALALEIRRLAEEGKRIVILDGYPRNVAWGDAEKACAENQGSGTTCVQGNGSEKDCDESPR